jgi:hypothetical protein
MDWNSRFLNFFGLGRRYLKLLAREKALLEYENGRIRVADKTEVVGDCIQYITNLRSQILLEKNTRVVTDEEALDNILREDFAKVFSTREGQNVLAFICDITGFMREADLFSEGVTRDIDLAYSLGKRAIIDKMIRMVAQSKEEIV